MRVLIVDDNRNFGLFLRSSLMTRGYEARAAASTEEALAAACEDRYELFIISAGMRDPDGHPLHDALATTMGLPPDHVVLMTSNVDEAPDKTHPVLRKPFRLSALLQIVHDLVPH